MQISDHFGVMKIVQADELYKGVRRVRTKIIQYKYDRKTSKYEKVVRLLPFNELVLRSALDLVKVLHRYDGKALKHALKIKASIIASLIIKSIVLIGLDQNEKFLIFDWNEERAQNWSKNYMVQRGPGGYFDLEEKILKMLTDPTEDYWSIIHWIEYGFPYEINLAPHEHEDKNLLSQETSPSSSLIHPNERNTEETIEKSKIKTISKRLRNWIKRLF